MTTRTRLSVIFFTALLLRLAVNCLFQGINSSPDPSASIDHVRYDALAKSIAAGEGYMLDGGINTYIAPGTPFLISIIYKFFGIKYFLVRLMFCLMGALTCMVIYVIGNRLAGEKVGLAAAAALAVYPMHIHFSQHFLSEVPWGLFMALAMVCALYLQDTGRLIFSVLFGLLVGITAYIRPVSILYFPIFAVLLLVYYGSNSSKILVKRLIVPAILFLLILAPWTFRNFVVTKHFVAVCTNSGFAFWDGNNEKSFTDPARMGAGDTDINSSPEFKELLKIKDPFAREQAAYRNAISAIKRHLGEFPKLEIMKLYRLVTPFYETGNKLFDLVGGLSWAILFPFSVFGMVRTARDRRYLSVHTLVLMAIIAALIWFGSYRYREAIGPFLVLYGAVGFYFFLDKLKRKKIAA